MYNDTVYSASALILLKCVQQLNNSGQIFSTNFTWQPAHGVADMTVFYN